MYSRSAESRDWRLVSGGRGSHVAGSPERAGSAVDNARAELDCRALGRCRVWGQSVVSVMCDGKGDTHGRRGVVLGTSPSLLLF